MKHYKCPKCSSIKVPLSGWDSRYPPEDNPSDKEKWWFTVCQECGYKITAKTSEELDSKLLSKWKVE